MSCSSCFIMPFSSDSRGESWMNFQSRKIPSRPGTASTKNTGRQAPSNQSAIIQVTMRGTMAGATAHVVARTALARPRSAEGK